jgi:hypothetical protein
MNGITVGVKKTVSFDRIADLLCTGFEGGLSFYIRVGKKHKPEVFAALSNGMNDYPLYSYPLTPDGYVIIYDITGSDGSPDDRGKEYRLDFKAIENGLKIMAEKYARHFDDFINENDDSATGDVFIQCCLFGEIVYG